MNCVADRNHFFSIRLFLPYRHLFHFERHIPTLFYALRLPSSDPDSIHPALLNAMFLAACSCAGLTDPELKQYEETFLLRTRAQLDESLAFVNRLTDFLWASLIIAWWHSHQGDTLPTHRYVTSGFCLHLSSWSAVSMSHQ